MDGTPNIFKYEAARTSAAGAALLAICCLACDLTGNGFFNDCLSVTCHHIDWWGAVTLVCADAASILDDAGLKMAVPCGAWQALLAIPSRNGLLMLKSFAFQCHMKYLPD